MAPTVLTLKKCPFLAKISYTDQPALKEFPRAFLTANQKVHYLLFLCFFFFLLCASKAIVHRHLARLQLMSALDSFGSLGSCFLQGFECSYIVVLSSSAFTLVLAPWLSWHPMRV
jgi:hypothetical protein